MLRTISALIGWMALLTPAAHAQPLPEGNEGIAARYSGDEGIDSDADVVFVEDFEEITDRLDFSDRWNNVWGALNITTEPANVHAGNRAIEITATEPERSQGAQHDLAGYDELFVRYYMKYHRDFPGMHHTGISLFAGAPGVGQADATGVRPDGERSFQALLDTLSPMFGWSPPDNRPPGMLEVYCYHMDQSDVYGDVFFSTGEGRTNLDVFGDTFEPRANVIPERDRWYSFEMMVQANAPGSDDGRVAFWVDGELAGDFPSIRFRTVDALQINQAIITTYVSELADDQTVWYDDIVIARSYIGPMVTEEISSDGGVPDGGGSDAGVSRADGGVSAADGGRTDSGGGCSTASAGSSWGLWLVALLFARRLRAR